MATRRRLRVADQATVRGIVRGAVRKIRLREVTPALLPVREVQPVPREVSVRRFPVQSVQDRFRHRVESLLESLLLAMVLR